MIVCGNFLLGIKEIFGTSGSLSLVDQSEQCERRSCLLTLKGTLVQAGLENGMESSGP